MITNQIRAQLEDHEGVASLDLGASEVAMEIDEAGTGDPVAECRVIISVRLVFLRTSDTGHTNILFLKIDVQIGTYHLLDNIEWDLLSTLTPEAFTQKLCTELGLSGEAVPLISHAIHEELIKHKKDAVEWGVIGGDKELAEEALAPAADKPRDKSGASLLKDKTGLGLGWGRAPKDGRGPKVLKSVWRDWAELEDFKTRFEVLSAEEVERREIEKERASR